MRRTEKSYSELYCSRCDAHLGNMLDEGPLPDGKRYCVSGVAMKFIAENEDNRKKAEILRKKAKISPQDISLEEWKLILTPEQFRITRMKENEEPFTSGLERAVFEEEGIFRCVCCNGPLFNTLMKRNADVGWPTFSDRISKRKGGTISFRYDG